jgi:hypothetical protein
MTRLNALLDFYLHTVRALEGRDKSKDDAQTAELLKAVRFVGGKLSLAVKKETKYYSDSQ